MFSINWYDDLGSYSLVGDKQAVSTLYGVLVRQSTRSGYYAAAIHIYQVNSGTEINPETWEPKFKQE